MYSLYVLVLVFDFFSLYVEYNNIRRVLLLLLFLYKNNKNITTKQRAREREK